ncbi:heme biosynthesis protein HemY [Parvularcula lutaonensis]|uniref:Heme biosynthesis protein HemY n=1 Tax=Parvularcula lutaonensis TaxID=491923 RepID=A0ABV7MBG8_9PROT|nr:heme biosynthesis HemY N-terminal domain-containing protein [Parvularcula lutaonensis]GGY37347.1 hypothetical protein GCM10007148_01960 [Parvularcula lutaonensis]
MIRIFTLIVVVLVATWGLGTLLDLTGYTVIEINGQRIDVQTGVLAVLTVLAVLFFFFSGAFVSWVSALPGRLRRRSQERRRAKGMTALTRGLEAVAAGDAADAQRFARLADKSLNEPALTRLLTAQAAQLAGDTETAQLSYTAMLEAPETEFLGLRGLYMQALQSGDREKARAYAERAFQLRPGTSWAFESVLNLNIERGAWGDALDTLSLARKHNIADSLEYRRMEGALLTAQAYGAFDAEDHDQALKDALAALKKAPTLTPAAALAAEIEVNAGHRSKAAKILADAWEAEPHPGLAAVLRRIFAHERDERVRGRLIKLTERNPDHPESKLLLAQVQLEGGDPAAAQETLEPLLIGRPNRRVLRTMADITQARYGEAAATAWRIRAEAAPEEVIPGADGTFHYTTEGWRRLIREFSEHGRLAPPPLEVETPEIGADEVRALLMPPAPETPLATTEVADETNEAPPSTEPETEAAADEPPTEPDAETEAEAEEVAPDDEAETVDQDDGKVIKLG